MIRTPTITLATTCMDRFEHITKTFPQNVATCVGRGVELLLLNYDGDKRLDAWLRGAFDGFIAHRFVTYARRIDVSERWHANHAKNVALLLAVGDVVVNVDADNYVSDGFIDAVRRLVPKPGSYATVGSDCEWRDCTGRMAFWRSDLIALGGYDEAMTGWGYTDADLRDRASRTALREVHFRGADLASPIGHVDEMRTRHLDTKSKNVSFTLNRARSVRNCAIGAYAANTDQRWGVASVRLNFSDVVDVGKSS